MELNFQLYEEPVAPVRPVAPYIEGKRRQAARLIAPINTVEHDTYAEAFVGMGPG